MLLDKAGWRENKSAMKGKFVQRRKEPLTKEEREKQNIQMALRYGIGYKTYKKEVDAIRAKAIRERLEQNNIK